MFLNRLKKKEKMAFLELAHYVARSDSNFSEDQESIIEKYCMEMQIKDISYDENKFDIYKSLSKIKTNDSKKIVLLELMALIYSDDFLHEEERIVLEKILEEFDLSYNLSIVYAEWAKTMLSLYKQGNALINL
ncbi:TerB family tellurite resistance protein [Malaciobacter halophilus]|nr:TerB family tellurite resistance protein [Malaciobacter halophilus]RYA24549.1 TerB family tellurite resistance protein [Malaciobacter halophilus]